MIAAFQDTPSPESVILDQLVVIQKQLKDIQVQIQRIDEKLDTIFTEMIAGFDRVQRGIDVILSDLAENTAITLETQLIVREEGNRIYDALLQTTYGPCTLAVLNQQEFDSVEYRRCAYLLFEYATDGVFDAEIAVSDQDSADTLSNKLLDLSTIGRSTNGLRSLYVNRNSGVSQAKVASFERWYHAVTIYKDFLLHSPAQAIEAFPRRLFGFSSIVNNALLLQEFRNSIFEDYDKSVFYAPDIPSSNPLARLSTLNSQISRKISSTINSELVKYNRVKGLSISGILGPVSEQQGRPTFSSINSSTKGTKWSARLNTNTHRWLFTKGPWNLWRAANAGLGYFEPKLIYRGTDTSKYNCGFLNLSSCLRANADNYRLELIFVETDGTQSRVGYVDFKVTSGGPKNLGSGFVSNGVKLCTTQECIETGIANVANDNSAAFRLDNTSALYNKLTGQHYQHRVKVAENVFSTLVVETRNTSSAIADNTVKKETTYFAALNRFAFAEVLDQNDAIHAIATAEYTYPTLGSVLSQMSNKFEIYELADFMSSQYRLIESVIRSQSVRELRRIASNSTELSNIIVELRQMDDFLQKYSDIAPEPVVPTAPKPLSPATGAMVEAGTTIQLKFAVVANASRYHVRVFDRRAKTWSYDNDLVSKANCDGSTCTLLIGGLPAQERAVWLVRAVNPAGWGAWSDAVTFDVKDRFSVPAVPRQIAPANGGVVTSDSAIEISFTPVANALRYHVKVFDRAGKTTSYSNDRVMPSVCNSSTCSISVPGLSVQERAVWWVRAVNQAGWGAWSSPVYFDVKQAVSIPAMPKPISPAEGGTIVSGGSLQLSFVPVVNATHYQVKVFDRVAGKDVYTNERVLPSVCIGNTCTISVPGLPAQQRAAWWVRSVNEAGYRRWGSPLYFDVKQAVTKPLAPRQIAPAAGTAVSTGSSIEISFAPVANASRYHVKIFDRAGKKISYSNDRVMPSSCSGSTCTISVPGLPVQERAAWWVRAVNQAGWGAWSEPVYFDVEQVISIPPSPRRISPAEGAAVIAGGTLQLKFAPVANATSYHVKVFDRVVGEVTYSNERVQPSVCSGDICTISVPGLPAQERAAWWVRAVNEAGFRKWDAPTYFDVKQAVGKPAAPRQIAPGGGEMLPSGDTISISFAPVADASRYHIRLFDRVAGKLTYSNERVMPSSCSGSTCTISVPGLPVQERAAWWVRAVNQAGWGAWSEPTYFDVVGNRQPLLAAGRNSTCVADEELTCWGYGVSENSLGRPLKNPVDLTVGYTHACALDGIGVVCWGSVNNDNLTVPALSNPFALSVDYSSTCALDDTGVVCWGAAGSIADVPYVSEPEAIFSGSNHRCVLDSSGLKCWGDNTWGQLDVPILQNPTSVALGAGHSCALDELGVTCWGLNNYGQTDVPFLMNPQSITAGARHTCALDENGVTCWGNEAATSVPELANPTAVSAGKDHTCALDSSGYLCWGADNTDQLQVPYQLGGSD